MIQEDDTDSLSSERERKSEKFRLARGFEL